MRILITIAIIALSSTPSWAEPKHSKGGRVLDGRPAVRGALDKKVIKAVITRHIKEVRYCYQKQLAAKSSLAGRLIVQFTIGPAGKVLVSKVQKTTLNDAKVEGCVLKAFRRWRFPKPKGGGIVIVSYPFVFRGTGQPAEAPPAYVQGGPTVRGALPKAEIQRIVANHRNEVRYCYQKELVKKPGLSGKAVVQFTISPKGRVVMTKITSSNHGSPKLNHCLATAVKRWLFPKPKGGGIVIVSYPFLLRTNGVAGGGLGSKGTTAEAGGATVRGALGKQVIQRVIRKHLNQVRYCYQKVLVKQPSLSGRVTLQFTIAASGRVVMSKVKSNTFKSPKIGSCIAKAARRWLFPKPKGGGIVVVTYPFSFSAGN